MIDKQAQQDASEANNAEEQEEILANEAENIEEASDADVAQMLAACQEEAAKNLEGWQRALADLANARKRFEKQSQMAYDNATVAVVSKLLPVIDDFDRAIENVPADVAETSWFDGMTGALRKLNSILEGINAERIPAVGEPFDPNVHDALSTEASTEHESGTVVRELVAGYRIGDRVIRPALVIVAE